MARGYTIPGYFENCIVKGDEVKENKLFGKTLFRYSRHELKEAKLFGSTVLVFKNGGIYERGLFGKKLFSVSKSGEVKENKLFGRVVGSIPPEWMDGYEVDEPKKEDKTVINVTKKTQTSSYSSTTTDSSLTKVINEDGSTTYSGTINGVNLSVTASIPSIEQDHPTAEELFMKEYVEVYAYAMFLNKYTVCKAPNEMKEEQYAHWQFMNCGVKEVNRLHKELFEKGFYKPASVSEKLSIYKVGEIKNVASQLGITTSGKKDEIIQRISKQASLEQVNNIIKDNVFSLSAYADEYLKEHKVEIEYYYNNSDESISLQEYIKKRKIFSVEDLQWQECIKALRYDDENYGRNIYYRMSGICAKEGRKEQALFYLIMVLRLDLSGVFAFTKIKMAPDEQDFRKASHSEIFIAPRLLNDIYKYKDYYNETIVDDVYSRTLPLDASNKEMLKEILSKLFNDEPINDKEYIVPLKGKFEEVAASLKF